MLLPLIAAMFLQVDPAALRPLYEQALERRKQEFGATDPRTAQAARDLGLFLAGLRDGGAARPALAEAVRIDEQAFGPDAPATLADVAELAAVSPAPAAAPLWKRATASPDPAVAIRAWMALGDYRKALELQEQAAGSDSPAIPTILQSLAATVPPSDAIPLLQRALVVNRKNQGPVHPSNAPIESTLAEHLLAARRLDDALAAAADAVAICQQTVGMEHPRTARAVTTLARVLAAQKQLDRAESMYRLALKIDEAAYGPRHPQTLADARVLAAFLEQGSRPVH